MKDVFGTSKCALLMAVVFSLAMTVVAAGEDFDSEGQSLVTLRHVWEIAPEISHIKYEEPGVMKQDGAMLGIGLSYTYHSIGVEPIFERIFGKMETGFGGLLRGEIRFSGGEVDYDGSLLDGTPIKQDNIDDRLFEGRGLIGFEHLGEEAVVGTYVGLGYRYLNDDSSSYTSGYERESNYLYMPVGIEGRRALGDGWAVGGSAEFDFFLWGKQQSDLRRFGEGIIENDQDSGYGFRFSLRLEKDDFIIEPFIRYWDIDESDVDNGWVEPANETTEYGVKFIWRF
jgi:hypothetical protein